MSSQVQVVAEVHEQPNYSDVGEPSVEVIREDGVAQAWGVDEHGMKGKQTADIEPPNVVPEPNSPETSVKQVYVTEMSPEDKTKYSMGDSPIKPHVLRQRSPVRTRVFPPKPVVRAFRGYYPDSSGIQCSPIKQRMDPRP